MRPSVAVAPLSIVLFSLPLLLANCGGAAGPAAPTSVAPPTPTPAIGSVALFESSLPSGSTVPTSPLTFGHAAPTLFFRYGVRMNEAQTGILAQIWVRNATQRCMGAGAASLSFIAGEQKILTSLNMSFNDSTGNPCRLPYTTDAIEITVAKAGVVLFSQQFPGAYTFVAGN